MHLIGIVRTPIRRRIDKANKQIKGAKEELGLVDVRGIFFLVYDIFRNAPPGFVLDVIRCVLGEKDRHRSVDAVIYITNHCVVTAESSFAGRLGHPPKKRYHPISWPSSSTGWGASGATSWKTRSDHLTVAGRVTPSTATALMSSPVSITLNATKAMTDLRQTLSQFRPRASALR